MAWAKMPSRWILSGGLKDLRWREVKGEGTAALLLLMAVAILKNRQGMSAPADRMPDETLVLATYDMLQSAANMSRSMLARALRRLVDFGLVERTSIDSAYRLPGVAEDGQWAQLPQSYLYSDGTLSAFRHFGLRSMVELEALKLYLLMLAFRNTKTGYTHIGYEKINEHTGIEMNHIKRAQSMLVANNLLYVESDPNGTGGASGRLPLRYTVLGFRPG